MSLDKIGSILIALDELWDHVNGHSDYEKNKAKYEALRAALEGLKECEEGMTKTPEAGKRDESKPEKLFDLSRRAENARSMYSALCDEYIYAQAAGKMDLWEKSIIAYTRLISDQEKIEKRIKS